MAQGETLCAVRAVVGSGVRSLDDLSRLFSPDPKPHSAAGQSCPDTWECRSMALFPRGLCGTDRRDSVPWAATDVSHAAHFGPRALLEIRDAYRRSYSGIVVRIGPPYQFLDRERSEEHTSEL